MSRIDILVPDLPESIVDATIVTWHKKPGDIVFRDEILVEIETDKVILEIPASVNGILDVVLANEGTTVTSRQILGHLCDDSSYDKTTDFKLKDKEHTSVCHQHDSLQNDNLSNATAHDIYVENNLKISNSEDINNCISKKNKEKKRVPMTHIRKRAAERMLEAKNSTVMLTTFNEVNMQPIIELRKQYGDLFEQRYNIRLGFMSFYVKAVVKALKYYPEINTFIDGNDIVYHDCFDVSVAISTKRGLVTPVLHNVDTMGMADIETKIKELAIKGHDGKLTIEDLIGGNFTITNGGVFGSLMSTPIINPPQSAILGIHAIKDRPMAMSGKIKILPMMYVALSYDHRLIDGRESISFLVTVKELLEDPIRMLLDI